MLAEVFVNLRTLCSKVVLSQTAFAVKHSLRHCPVWQGRFLLAAMASSRGSSTGILRKGNEKKGGSFVSIQYRSFVLLSVIVHEPVILRAFDDISYSFHIQCHDITLMLSRGCQKKQKENHSIRGMESISRIDPQSSW